MSKTQFQDIGNCFIQDDIDLYESSGTYDVIEFGGPVWLSSGEARKVTDVDAPQKVIGLSYTRPATGVTALDYPKDKIAVVLFPCKIRTNNVDSSNPPEAGKEVYILDDGTFSDEDGGTCNERYGYCTKVYADGTYFLVLDGPTYDET